MAFCCESFIFKKEIVKTMLEAVEKIIGEHFFSSCGLLKFGWYFNYQLDSKIARYPIELGPGLGSIRKTQIVEFYWFSLSLVRYDKNKSLDQVNVCSCLYCRIFYCS